MQLPQQLQESIENRLLNQSIHQISEASSCLSEKYRQGVKNDGYVQTNQERMAYILSRMPATYASIVTVFKELRDRMPSFNPKSFFDLGSGPGTGLWAADTVFPNLIQYSAWEIDDEFNKLSALLTEEHLVLKNTIRKRKNLELDRDFFSADLVLLSYAIGEIPSQYWESIFSDIWKNVNHSLVIVEPGTPIGYERILKIRDILLRQDAHLIAPCPHSSKCPLQKPDWCHFYARVERSALHRKIKNASLNYEDEKFSYLVFSKHPIEKNINARILRYPQVLKGHTKLITCDKSQIIQNLTITKKEKEKYKLAKKKDWGDSF
ncbi:MAG: hypothetical protein FJZ57_04715 [Chlamydiae bacterium]|nr:hypothetical protein [Chlamydiota bacterium]